METMDFPSGTVTFLFTDIEGSTRLLERLREDYARVLEEQRQILRESFERWNGHEIDTQGDSFFASFSRAIDALACVIETQRELAAHEWPQSASVQVRMGLHTGEPLVLGGGGGYVGMDVHRAARIAYAGYGGQVLLSQTTRDLVVQDLPRGVTLRDLGSYQLKDIRFAQQIYQLEIEGLPGEFPPLRTLSAEVEPPTPGEPPYKGLVNFEEQDAAWFFGRQAAAEKLMQALEGQRFLAVIGASGSGKSSLVRAGLLPIFRRSRPKWQVHLLTPTNHPLEALALSLTCQDSSASASATINLIDELGKDPRCLHMYISKTLTTLTPGPSLVPRDRSPFKGKGGRGEGVLLVIDQFEELFSLCKDESERQAFIDSLIYAVEHEGGKVSLVIALRADFYNRLAQYDSLRQLVARHQEYLGVMSGEELRQAIEEPARLGGWEFSPGLVDLMLHDIGASEGHLPEPGALPLLSHALLETWKRRRGTTMRLRSYAEAGSVRGAIARTAEAVYYGEFSPEQQQISRSIFLRLAEPGEGEQDTRRRAALSELIPAAGQASAEQVSEVLNRLANARLVTVSEGNVEVAHEALIREWPALREWLAQDREGLRLHHHLTEAANEWERMEREPGLLYRGARLAQAVEWAQINPDQLNQLEEGFLESSRQEIEKEQAEREAQRQRELEAAQKLAESEHERAEDRSAALQRQRRRAYLLAVALLVAAALAVVAFQFARRSQASATVAQNEANSRATQEAVAVAAKGEALELVDLRSRDAQVNQSLALAAQSQIALQADNLDLALALAMEAIRIPDPPGKAQMALSEAAYAPGTIRVFSGHQDWVNSVAVSPDGRYGLSGDQSGVIFLWDLESGAALRRLEGHTDAVLSVAFTPDGRQAVSGSWDKSIIHWDLETGQVIKKLEGHLARVNTVAVSPDGRLVASGSGRWTRYEPYSSEDNSLRIWDLESGEEIRRFVMFNDSVNALRFTANGRHLAVGTASDGFLLLEVETGKVLFRRNDGPMMWSLQVGPDGKTVLIGYDNDAVLSDLLSGETIQLGSHNSQVTGLDISPDGQRGLTTSPMSIIEYDLQTRQEILRFNFGASSIAYLPDGQRALGGYEDGTLRLLALSNGAEIGRLPVGFNWRRGIAYDPGGQGVITNDTWSLERWDLETGKQIWDVSIGSGLWDVALSSDGKLVLVSELSAGYADLVDADTGATLMRLPSDDSYESHGDAGCVVDAVTFNPSGKFGLSGAQGDETTNNLIYWDLETGKPVWLFDTGAVLGVAISPDGHTALSAEGGPTVVKWWDLESGELIRTLEGHTHIVWSVAFIDDRTAISASDDGTMILWDLENGSAIHSFLGHSAGIKRVTLSPDKRRALSASRDGSAILWDVQTGEPLRRYTGHSDELMTIAWGPDGEEALSGSRDMQAIRWRIDADLETLLDWVEHNRFVRELTCDERMSYRIEPLCMQEEEIAATEPASLLLGNDTALLPALLTPTPIVPPVLTAPIMLEAGRAIRGVNQGSIAIGEGQAWEYAGKAGERISLHVAADKPANLTWNLEQQQENGLLDPTLAIYTPNGSLLAKADDLEGGLSTDAYLAALTLPQDDLYRIEVRSYQDQSGGSYRLVLAPSRPLVFRARVPTAASLAIHPDGKATLAGMGFDMVPLGSIAGDYRIWEWNLATGDIVRYLDGHADTPVQIAISPDGLRALSAGLDGQAILWDLQSGGELQRLDNQGQLISDILFLPNGKMALTATTDALSLWELDSGEVLQRFEGHEDWVIRIALSPDGATAYSTSWDFTLRAWDVASGELLATYRPFNDGTPCGLAISPDGSKLLVSRAWDTALVKGYSRDRDASIALIDAITGESLLDLTGHTWGVWSVAFSPDGRYALSGSGDQTVRLWDITTGKQLAVFYGHAGDVLDVAFSPDGLTGYSTGGDGTLRVWDLREYILGVK